MDTRKKLKNVSSSQLKLFCYQSFNTGSKCLFFFISISEKNSDIYHTSLNNFIKT